MEQRSLFTWFSDLLKLKNIPEELKDESPYLYSQLFNIQMGMIFVIVILVLYGCSYVFLDNPQIPLISVLTFAGTLSCYLYYRKDPVNRKCLISNILLSILFIAIAVVVLNTGGLHSSSLVWFAMLPSYMVLVNGFKNAFIWLSISLTSFILLFLFDPFITNLPQYKSSTPVEFFIDFIVMTLFSLLVINTVDSSKKTTLNKLTETQNKLKILATTDSLTGLYNRRFFIERAEAEINRSIRRNTPLAVIMADLDNFKKINDSHGHVAGDQILIRIAEIIRNSLRDSDISGRYGGGRVYHSSTGYRSEGITECG